MVHSLLVVDFTDAESYSHYDIWNQQLGKLDIRSILTVIRITIKYCCCQREEEGMRVCLSFFQSLQGHCHDPRHHQRSEFAFVVAESFVLWQCVGTILAGKKGSAGEGREAQKEQEQEERYLLRGLYYFQKMNILKFERLSFHKMVGMGMTRSADIYFHGQKKQSEVPG